jgi:superfamily II DNA or RNA helicase
VDTVTSFMKTGYQFSPAFKRKLSNGKRAWDGKIHLLSPIYHTFPTGVLPFIVKALRDNGHQVELDVLDESRPLPVVEEFRKVYAGKTPWKHQVEAVDAFLSGGQRGVIRVATAGGKTLISAMTITALGIPQTLMLIKGQNLVDQTADELSKFLGSENVGIVMAEDYNPAKVIVGSVNTLASRLDSPEIREMLASIRLVIVDEAHLVGKGAHTFHKVLDLCPAPARLGMSGTPLVDEQDSDMMLISRTGPLLYDLQPSALQDKGILAQAELNVTRIIHPIRAEYTYREAIQHLIIENHARSFIIVNQVIDSLAEGRKVLLIGGNSVQFVRNLETLYKFACDERKVSYPSMFVTGADGRIKSRQAVAGMRSGKIQLLCNTVLFDMGTDIPALDDVFMAAPLKAYSRLMQRLGRGLRGNNDSSKVFRAFDYIDLTNPYLVKHYQARAKVYRNENIFSVVNTLESTFIFKPNPHLIAELESHYRGEEDDSDC